MPTPLVLLSIALITTGVPGTWPQVARLARKRTADGLSSTAFLTNLVSATAWATYGSLMHHGTQILTNGSALVANLLVVTIMWRLRSVSLASASMACAFLAAVVVFGMTGAAVSLGIMASMLDLSARLPQVWKAIRRPGGAGVSTTNFIVNAANAAAWVVYGIVNADVIITASSVYCAAANAFVAWRTYSGRRVLEHRDQAHTGGAAIAA